MKANLLFQHFLCIAIGYSNENEMILNLAHVRLDLFLKLIHQNFSLKQIQH